MRLKHIDHAIAHTHSLEASSMFCILCAIGTIFITVMFEVQREELCLSHLPTTTRANVRNVMNEIDNSITVLGRLEVLPSIHFLSF